MLDSDSGDVRLLWKRSWCGLATLHLEGKKLSGSRIRGKDFKEEDDTSSKDKGEKNRTPELLIHPEVEECWSCKESV